jgi:hypothetical protein
MDVFGGGAEHCTRGLVRSPSRYNYSIADKTSSSDSVANVVA